MWLNFTVRSVKPSVRRMERWEGEGEAGRTANYESVCLGPELEGERPWLRPADICRHTQIDTSLCTEAYIQFIHILKEY